MYRSQKTHDLRGRLVANMSASVPTQKLLTREDVATYLRVCPQTVTALVRAGKLACYKLGPRNWRFSMEQVETYLSQVTSPPQVESPPKKKRVSKDIERRKKEGNKRGKVRLEIRPELQPELRLESCNVDGKESSNLLARIRSCR